MSSVLVEFTSQMQSHSLFSRQAGFRSLQITFHRVWTTLDSESTVTKPCVHRQHRPAEMGPSITSPACCAFHYAAMHIMGSPDELDMVSFQGYFGFEIPSVVVVW